VYASFMGEMDVARGSRILQERQIAHYILPESMCRACAAANFFKVQKELRDTPAAPFVDVKKNQAESILNEAKQQGRTYLPEAESVPVLEAYGLPILPSGFAPTAEEAAKLAERVGFPVVVKVVSDDIIHKFDVKGVVLDVRSREDVAEAWESIHQNIRRLKPDARIKGVYVQKMVSGGLEVILGVKRDPSFGPVIMFGLGGIFVEIFRDVSFRVTPVTASAAAEMIAEIKAFGMLAGARGKKRRDIASIENAILRLSQLAVDLPQIQELDINPLIVHDEGGGSFVADARILL